MSLIRPAFVPALLYSLPTRESAALLHLCFAFFVCCRLSTFCAYTCSVLDIQDRLSCLGACAREVFFYFLFFTRGKGEGSSGSQAFGRQLWVQSLLLSFCLLGYVGCVCSGFLFYDTEHNQVFISRICWVYCRAKIQIYACSVESKRQGRVHIKPSSKYCSVNIVIVF